jgi:soluble lytic murein transglycosylase
LHELVRDPDIYGLMAAERLGSPYPLRQKAIELTPTQETAIVEKPPIKRAYELFRLGLFAEARAEWDRTTKDISPKDAEGHAALASRWGWHDRAIITSNRAHLLTDLHMRYPLPLYARVTATAASTGVEPAVLFGFMRTESAFMADARSPVGALGLLQLMPATGREVGNQLGKPIVSTEELLDVDRNLLFGASYVRKMLDKFDGNIALAAAAYNAGAGRAKRWMPDDACHPLDIWIELIPFDETREYVKRILLSATVYGWRLSGQAPSLTARVARRFYAGAPAASTCVAQISEQTG